MTGKKTGRRYLVIPALLVCLGVWPWSVVHAAGDGVEVTEITGDKQLARMVSDSWDDEYYAEVLVDTQTEEVTVNGEEVSFEEVFDVEDSADVPELESVEAVEEYFEDQVCETEVVEDGVVQVTNPWQTRQILLRADKLDQDYGASEIFWLDMLEEYVLQFDTEEATKAAYEQMQPVYGDRCMPNRVIQGDDMLMSGAGSDQGSYSWGASYMEMTQLKTSPFLSSLFQDRKAKVAVVDTGIDVSNFLFRGRAISGINVLTNSSYIYDDSSSGHGTHVAGIVADSTPANVELMILKVLDYQGNTFSLALQYAIYAAVNNGADVINMSLGADQDISTWAALTDPGINYAASRGVAICVAAGNDSRNAAAEYPACNATTITVSAMGPDGNFDSRYSNYGSIVDFCAPGTAIISAARGGTLKPLDGTSMASPHIAAAVAYIKMVMPGATLDEVRAVLRKYAVDLGAPGKDDYYGYGAVKLKNLFEDYQSIDISKYTVSLPGGSSVAYTGKACEPTVQVAGLTSQCYTVSYANNVDPGTATVTVTGKGNYTGTIKADFKIVAGKPTLSSADNTSGGIKVTWKAAKGATGYEVHRRTGTGGSWKKVKTINSGKTVKWTDKTAANGKVYGYRIYAVYNGTKSGASSTKTICRLTSTELGSLKNVSGKKMTAKWKKNSKAGGYQIQYSTSKKFSSAKTVKASAKSATITISKLKKGKTYYARIRSYKKTGGKTYYSAWSSAKKVVVRK